jgi:hypothetical protein
MMSESVHASRKNHVICRTKMAIMHYYRQSCYMPAEKTMPPAGHKRLLCTITQAILLPVAHEESEKIHRFA